MTVMRSIGDKGTETQDFSRLDVVDSVLELPGAFETDPEPLFSVLSGEGDGFMLGMAAGDSAGGAWELGYSAITEQVSVIAYQLIETRRLDMDELVLRIRELDGSEYEENVYRSETPHFRAWLDRAAAGAPTPEEERSTDALSRAVPLGVAFRKHPAALVSNTIALGRLFHRDAGSIAAGVITAAGVAASCFAQSGRDLVAGVAETVIPATEEIAADAIDGARLDTLESEFETLVDSVGAMTAQDAIEAVGGDIGDPVSMAQLCVLLAAPFDDVYHSPVEQAARAGGSGPAAATGAMVGARIGIRAWPWAFANDTWFAEIGRRLVRGPDEVRDLPIPYAVEQHLISGVTPGLHR